MKNVVLKGLDVCICSTKKMKSKADKVYITFKCHFQMLSIKGISIFKIDAISIQRCFAFENLNVNSLIKHVTYFLFRFVHKNRVRRFETRKTEKGVIQMFQFFTYFYIDIDKIYNLHFYLTFHLL